MSTNKFQKLIEIIDEISRKSDEAKDLLNQIFKSLNREELSLEEIEERLFLIRNLSRKLNLPINELPEFLEVSKEKLKLAENYGKIISDLEKHTLVFHSMCCQSGS